LNIARYRVGQREVQRAGLAVDPWTPHCMVAIITLTSVIHRSKIASVLRVSVQIPLNPSTTLRVHPERSRGMNRQRITGN
ncbi:MAG: hypothetical protein ACRD1H_16460, partial [Vicinamibacterales bacterium]